MICLIISLLLATILLLAKGEKKALSKIGSAFLSFQKFDGKIFRSIRDPAVGDHFRDFQNPRSMIQLFNLCRRSLTIKLFLNAVMVVGDGSDLGMWVTQSTCVRSKSFSIFCYAMGNRARDAVVDFVKNDCLQIQFFGNKCF